MCIRDSVRREQVGDLGEIGLEVLRADGLDHLDRHQFVVAALQVAVVLQHHADAIVQAGGAHPRQCHDVLLARDGGGGDVAAVVARGMDGESAPAAADLDHAVARAEFELAADGVQPVSYTHLNSATQRQHIEARCRERGWEHVRVITCDVNVLALPETQRS